jgi:hypothetical protein
LDAESSENSKFEIKLYVGAIIQKFGGLNSLILA